MAKEWYVIHTYSGYELKAKQNLEDRVKNFGKELLFGEILVPTENIVEMVKGKKRETKRKFFPGYILVNMELTDETWYIVKDTPKITGFVGGNKNPNPIPNRVERMISLDGSFDSASRFCWESGFPCRSPALNSSFGFSLAKRAKIFAGATGSWEVKVTAVGPEKYSSSSCAEVP